MKTFALCQSARFRYLTQPLCLATMYYLTGELGILLAVPPGYASAIFPPSGIALAGLLILGYRAWWGVLIGSFLINLTVAKLHAPITTYTPFLIALIIAIGASLQAAFGAYLLKRFADFPNPLATEKHVFKFMVFGGGISALVNASISVSTLVIVGEMPVSSFFTNWITWWVGDTIGIFIFTPLMLVWCFKEANYFADRKTIVTVIALITFSLITVIFSYEKKQEFENLKLKFNRTAFEFNIELQKTLEQNLTVLSSLRIFYSASNDINRHEFHIATTELIKKRNGIHALGWSPIVLDKDRHALELALQQEGFSEFEITEINADKIQSRAKQHEKYVPVIYIEPITPNKSALGYDLYSENVRRDVLNKAKESDAITLTPKITLVQNQTKEYSAFIAYIPVYQNGVPHDTLTH